MREGSWRKYFQDENWKVCRRPWTWDTPVALWSGSVCKGHRPLLGSSRANTCFAVVGAGIWVVWLSQAPHSGQTHIKPSAWLLVLCELRQGCALVNITITERVRTPPWPVASGFMVTPQADPANQMWSFAGGGSFGHHCSKHFPLDVGFLLCLAATLGCLNFSQRQIFIHQSVQCSTGQAWERERPPCLLAKEDVPPPPSHCVTWWSGTILEVIWTQAACVSFQNVYRRKPGMCFPKTGRFSACSFNSCWKVYS